MMAKTFYSWILAAVIVYNPSHLYAQAIQKTGKKTFIINTCTRDLDDFRKLAAYAARLKPYGNVQVNISTLSGKSFYEIPKQRSPWHQYACNNATPYKFFPDPKIAPYIPAEFVARNRQLLLAKAKILRDHGIEAAFFGSEPDFLPEAFFDANPEMMGPRVDHPRRSNSPAFAPCVSVKETQEMFAGMMAALLKQAPEIKTFYFKTNDAGSGLCWSEWLYSGPNGPMYCKNETTGERVEALMKSFKAGAAKAGREIDIYLSEPQGSSNFSETERTDIQNRLPRNCYFKSTDAHEIIRIGSDIAALYPVNGIMDVLAFLNSLKAVDINREQTVLINFRAFYDRGNESTEVEELLLAILEKHLRDPAADKLAELKRLSNDWAGKANADSVYQAFIGLDEAFRFRNSFLGNLYGINWNVGARMIDRPLVAAPQRLTPEEEAYFLPYVFNVSEQEARMDYTDIQGSRWSTSPDTIGIYLEKIKKVAAQFAVIGAAAPRQAFFHKMASALKIHASLIRSCGNFTAAQAIRDNNAGKLNGPIHRPDKESDYTGDSDLQKFNAIMRDELDNTQELIALLQKEGTGSLCLAKDAAHEDCFLLGPDIIAQLKKKRKIMIGHWTDIQDYLTTPFK